MKFNKLFILLVAFVHGCGCTGAFAQTEGVKAKFNYAEGVDYKSNLILNPSAELNTNFAAATGGTLARDTTSGYKINNKASYSWQGTALNQYVLFDTQAVYPDDVTEGNCEFKGQVKGAAAANYSAQILDASSNVLNTLVLPAGTTWQSFSVVYPCGAKDTRFPIIKQTTAGTPAALNFGKLYYGSATNIGSVAQSYFFGGMDQAGASGCVYSENTSSGLNNFVDLGTGTGCNAWTTTGSVSAVGTNDHRLIATNMRAGVYKIELAGNFNANAAQVCNFRLSDGTNVYQPQMIAAGTSQSTPNLEFTVPYSTAQGSTTFKIQASDSGAVTCSIDPSSAGLNTSWKIYYFPSQSQTVVRVENLDYAPRPYTPTFTGFGTVNTHNCKESRSGAFLKVDCTFITGTTTATEGRVSFPAGLVSAANIFSPSVAGTWDTTPVTATVYKSVLQESSVNYFTFGYNINTTSGLTKQTGSAMNGAGATISFKAEVPIAGWNSNANGVMVLPGYDLNVFKAIKNGAQTLTSTTSDITNWTASENTYGNFNATTGVFTYSKDAVCDFTMDMLMNSQAWSGAQIVEFFMVKSGLGAGNIAHPIWNAQAAGTYYGGTVSATALGVRGVAGDTVKLRGYSPTNKDLGSGDVTRFSGSCRQ